MCLSILLQSLRAVVVLIAGVRPDLKICTGQVFAARIWEKQEWMKAENLGFSLIADL